MIFFDHAESLSRTADPSIPRLGLMEDLQETHMFDVNVRLTIALILIL